MVFRTSYARLGFASKLQHNQRRRSALMPRQSLVLVPQSPLSTYDDTNASVKRNENASANATQGEEAMRITRVGMFTNLGMAFTKGSVGLSTGSNALVADALHSLSDLLSDLVTLWSVKVARLPPDVDHPYGYGKFESVGALSVGAILVYCGCSMGVDGIYSFQDIIQGGAGAVLPELSLPFEMSQEAQFAMAAGAAGVSIAAKEILYRATVRIGKQAKSKVLVANAWHHRTDAISSFVALGGILGTMGGFPLLDPVAAIAVSGMVAKTGVDICLDSVRDLTDKSVEEEVLELLKEVSRKVDDVQQVSDIRARRMGHYTLVDLRVHLHPRTSISMAQQIADRVRSQILEEVHDVSEVLVHIDVSFDEGAIDTPSTNRIPEHKMRPYREIRQDVRDVLAPIQAIRDTTHINTHWVPYEGGNGTFVDVAIVVQPNLQVNEANAVAREARRAIEAIPYVAEADIHLELEDEDESRTA